MKLLLGVPVLAVAAYFLAPSASEAPTGFDNKTNGIVDDATHAVDQTKFDEVEQVSDGLGPLYNAQSCRECHQNPTSGGASQVGELRVGHRGPGGKFENPSIPINHGSEIIKGRSLVNDRAICPSGAFPAAEIQEHVPDSEHIRTFRVSVNLLGDGFVEAVPDQTFVDLAKDQCNKSHHKICGQVLYVPVVEAPGQTAVGRFGWKDQQASLLSFSADAYLNEMGITSNFAQTNTENTSNGNSVAAFDTVADPEDATNADVQKFADFMRATRAPGRGPITAQVNTGSGLFDSLGCDTCHTPR